MSDLQMQQEDHPVHNVPRPTEDYQGDVVNRNNKGDKEPAKDSTRYGDNRSDLPLYREDNEYSYKNVRD